MNKRSSSPPPAYLESGYQHNEPAPPRPITSGPTDFPASSLTGLIYLQCIVAPLTKFICVIVMASSYCDDKLTPKESIHQIDSLFLFNKLTPKEWIYQTKKETCKQRDRVFLWVFLLNFLGALNVWPVVYYIHQPFRTMKRFKICSSGYCVGGFMLFLLDCAALSLGIWITYGRREEKDIRLLVIPHSILIGWNILSMIIIHTIETVAHDPYEDCAKYFLKSRKEESTRREKQLTIKESGPYRIVIENCGRNSFSNLIYVTRRVAWIKIDTRGHPNPRSHDVRFGLWLQEPLEPGENITFIPETHREEGSYSVQGFRSFGKDRGEAVTTSVENESHITIVKLIEEFYRDQERACLQSYPTNSRYR